MDSLASSYVQNLARGAAARLESARWDLKPDGMWQPRQKYRPGGGVEGFIAEDLPIPGTFRRIWLLSMALQMHHDVRFIKSTVYYVPK